MPSWRGSRAGETDDRDVLTDSGPWFPGAADEGSADVVVPTRNIPKLKRDGARRSGSVELNAAASVVLTGVGDDFERPIDRIGLYMQSNRQVGGRERVDRRNGHRQRFVRMKRGSQSDEQRGRKER